MLCLHVLRFLFFLFLFDFCLVLFVFLPSGCIEISEQSRARPTRLLKIPKAKNCPSRLPLAWPRSERSPCHPLPNNRSRLSNSIWRRWKSRPGAKTAEIHLVAVRVSICRLLLFHFAKLISIYLKRVKDKHKVFEVHIKSGWQRVCRQGLSCEAVVSFLWLRRHVWFV